MARLLLVDDHPLFRVGFARMVETLRPEWALTLATTAVEALAAVNQASVDLAIIDVTLPGDDGFVLLGAIKALAPDLPQILISGRDDVAVRVRASACGARCFIAKTKAPDAMVDMIEAVISGRSVSSSEAPVGPVPELTRRQAEVLMLLTEGHGNKEIRHRLCIAERTVRAHLTDLFELLGVHSRTQAIIRAREMGLIA